jgi:hypothetical protein
MEGREKAWFLDGGDECLHTEGVSLVEWATRVEEFLPVPRLALLIEHLSPQERRIRVEWVGVDPPEGAWRHLLEDLRTLVDPPGVLREACPPAS